MRENRELCDDRNHYYIDLNTPTSQTCPLKIDLTQLINNKEIHPVSSTRTLRKKKKRKLYCWRLIDWEFSLFIFQLSNMQTEFDLES